MDDIGADSSRLSQRRKGKPERARPGVQPKGVSRGIRFSNKSTIRMARAKDVLAASKKGVRIRTTQEGVGGKNVHRYKTGYHLTPKKNRPWEGDRGASGEEAGLFQAGRTRG